MKTADLWTKEELMEHFQFVEAGGGDDFTHYIQFESEFEAFFNDVGNQLYIFENGSWEHHDLSKQPDDEPTSAQARGNNLQSLHDYLLTPLTKGTR